MFQGTGRVTRELVTDEHGEGKLSINRLISLMAAVVLSYAFVKNSLQYNLGWDAYMGYAVGMAFSASPALVGKFLGLRYGAGNGNGPASASTLKTLS